MSENIVIKDAFEHNLKHLNLKIPIGAFTCVTGCSGCGKSSLVFDTIYAESQRGFLEGITGNAYGQKLMNKPKVGSVENLRPALNISQNYYNFNPRSTVGTITDISYYLRSLFALINRGKKPGLSESDFSANNPKSFCPNCMGLGIENAVSVDLLVPNKDVKLEDGAILFFKGPSESKEQKMLEAFCDVHGIDKSKKYSDLSKREQEVLLYSKDKVKCKLAYKEGRRRKQHNVILQGVVPSIYERMAYTDAVTSSIYSKYMEEVPCHVCGGSKLKPEILCCKFEGLNYADFEALELLSLRDKLKSARAKSCNGKNADLVISLIDTMINKLEALINLNLGYLSLNRSMPSLSGGERQRVRIATQLSCPLRGLIYIMDEPCRGLHIRDINNIIEATKNLVDNGNSVIAIEHNKKYISAANHIIELGPVGGPEGGYLIGEHTKVKPLTRPLAIKPKADFDEYVRLKGIDFRNIKNQTIQFPVGGITCITGVSGSGKTSLAHVLEMCFARGINYSCRSFERGNSIKRVVAVNQAPIGKTPRSTVVSYLGIYDSIRNLFADTPKAKSLKLGASAFSMNIKGGRCELCQGTGLQKIELNFLPNSYITCPDCNGQRFEDRVLSVDYKGCSITDILDAPIKDIAGVFADIREVSDVLTSMIKLGLGYLKLGQMSMNLSGGEAQRIKLAKALGSFTKGRNLYVLDEPTSGLNDVDIKRFQDILFNLKKNGDTIVAIEHNVEFVAEMSDWVIDFGLKGGCDGGAVMAQGDAMSVLRNPKSSFCGLDIAR